VIPYSASQEKELLQQFKVQMLTWECALLGEQDFTASVAETGEAMFTVAWDQPDTLRAVQINGGPPPEFYALWWACEHLRRQHAAA
jgi:hypothetical protein